MIDYNSYKKKVYEIFENRCLENIDIKDKIEYLKSNEQIIQNAFNNDVYMYENMGAKNIFNEDVIYSRVCSNLEDLY